MLSFEAQGTAGAQAIVEKLQVGVQEVIPSGTADVDQNLPFQQIQHRTDTIDAQPSAADGIIVLVTGALLVIRLPTLV